MRIANFRDDVLWAIAHKCGVDPDITRNGQGIMPDQADQWVSYLNAWIRRLYPSADYPEWTQIQAFVPNANHIVAWDALSFTGVTGAFKIAHPLKVYVVDPMTTYAPVDTPFRLTPAGIHVGFEHGDTVWIKFLPPCPRFTATEWDSNRTYVKDQVTYAPIAGQCFRSKVNGNRNHTPDATFQPAPLPITTSPVIRLPSEVIQPATAPDFGITGQPKRILVDLKRAGKIDVPNPPAASASFRITVLDTNGAVIFSAFSFTNGTDTLDLVVNDLTNQLIGGLGAGWTVTGDTVAFTITIENDSDFHLVNPNTGQDWPVYFGTTADTPHKLDYRQLQAYVAVASSATAAPQIIETPFGSDHFMPGSLYTFTFIDLAGIEHPVQYQSSTEDGVGEILAGITSAVQDGAATDPFFSGIVVALDTVSNIIRVASSNEISLDAQFTLPGNPWWALEPFPEELVDAAVRAVYADWLRAEGQADKGAPEEQAVGAEVGAIAARTLAPEHDKLTDQLRQ